MTESTTKQSRPMGKAGCLVGAILWLMLLCLPLFGFMLAIRGEIRLGESQRIWLIQEVDTQGLGWQSTQNIGTNSAGQICRETSVHYWLWKGSATGTEYCTCGDAQEAMTCP